MAGTPEPGSFVEEARGAVGRTEGRLQWRRVEAGPQPREGRVGG